MSNQPLITRFDTGEGRALTFSRNANGEIVVRMDFRTTDGRTTGFAEIIASPGAAREMARTLTAFAEGSSDVVGR